MSIEHDGRASERSMHRPRLKVFRGTPGLRRFYRNHKNRVLYSGYFGKKKRP